MSGVAVGASRGVDLMPFDLSNSEPPDTDVRAVALTLGASRTATTWSERWTGTWASLAAMLTSHKIGGKDGSCAVPALLREPTRKKEFADQIDVAFLDSDTGAPLAEIEAAINGMEWAAVISSTHSHMTTRTEAKLSHWDKFFVEHPDGTAADFLREEKHYVAGVAEGAEPIETSDDLIVIQHQPCPKYRVAVPLARPWLASDYATQSEANAVWKERIEALAAALHLDHDQSCTDTSRLFYLPRHPRNGAVPETAILAGTWCNIFALPSVTTPPDRGLFTGNPSPKHDAGEFADPDTGECIDLRLWAKSHGKQFEIVKALRARTASVFVGHVTEGGHHHIRCVNEDAHTSPTADRASFVVNASEASNEGFVYHCRHAHCTGFDRLFFVRRMLERGWLKVEDLSAPAYQRTGNAPTSEKVPANDTDITELRIINPVTLAGMPVPPREWIVEDWLPIGCVTANYGDGGVGKTLLSQQLMTAAAMEGGIWCGLEVRHCNSFAVFCEDDEDELHRRQAAICAAYGVNLSDLDAMRWVSRVGLDNSLMTFDQFSRASATPLYDAIVKGAKDHDARLAVLDTAADLFPANENDRHQVRRFIGQLTAAAIEIRGAVLLNAHPSRTGLSTGNLDGGSTAWNNGVRSRWSLARPAADGDAEPDVNERILTRRKANFASIGDNIQLQWRNGVLLPPQASGGGGAPDRAAAESVFLDLLDRCEAQGVFLSNSKNAGNFAPKTFGKRPDRKSYSGKDFEAAMHRLFEQKQIRSIEYDRFGHRRIMREIAP